MELKTGVVAHVWLRNELAISTNTGRIKILDKNTYELLYELTEHTQLVTSLDWSPTTNFLISGSQDRSIVIWNFDTTWRPVLVNFPTTTAITEVCWSPDGKKFAAGTGEGILGLGFYSQDFQLWNSKKIRAHKNAAILSLAFSNNGLYVVTGSVDMTVRVVSAYIKEVDVEIAEEEGREIMYEFNAESWANKVLWAQDSSFVAVATHDSRVLFWTPEAIQVQKWNGKPFATGAFLNPQSLVVAGYDLMPVLYHLHPESRNWAQGDQSLLKVVKVVTSAGEEAKTQSLPFVSKVPDINRSSSVKDTANVFESRSSVRDAAKMFESRSSVPSVRPQAQQDLRSTTASTLSRSSSGVGMTKFVSPSGHRSYINSIQVTSATTFTTTDVTGVLVFWSVS
jgi:WD40 repeat protein